MTMPHLENCLHCEDGWCLECVKRLGEENTDLRLAILEASRITFEHTHSDGDLDSDPELIAVKKCDHDQYRKAAALIGDVCRKWMI